MRNFSNDSKLGKNIQGPQGPVGPTGAVGQNAAISSTFDGSYPKRCRN